MKYRRSSLGDSRILSNIPGLFVFQFFRWFLVIMPVVVVYYQDHGLSLAAVMTVQAAFSVSMLVFEVPSGYMSDRLGRKPTLLTGTLLSAAGMAGMAFFPVFWGFIGSEILLGIGASCISGTDSSLLYDSLVASGREHEHHRIEGRIMATMNFSEAAASVLGGLLAVVSFRLGFLVQILSLLAASGSALLLVEPPVGENRPHPGFRDFGLQLRRILIHGGPRYIIAIRAIAGLGSFLAVSYVQPMLREEGFPLAIFGLVWASLNAVTGFSTLLSHRLPLSGHPRMFIGLIPFLFAAVYFLVSVSGSLFLIAAFLPFYILRGIQGPFFRNQLHIRLDSAHRATGLSLVSLMMRVLFSILAPLFGGIADRTGSHRAMAAIGLFFLGTGILNLVIMMLPEVRNAFGSTGFSRCRSGEMADGEGDSEVTPG